MVVGLPLVRFNNGLLLCFGHSGPNYSSNNFWVTLPIAYNDVISVVLGQSALVGADALGNTWDISIGSVTDTQLHVWARWGNTPGYYYLAIGY